MERPAVFIRKPERSENDFLRDLILKLATTETTPIDVLDSFIEPVQRFNQDVVAVTAYVKIEFTCSVCYYREEEYWDKEKRDGILVDVKKSKTVPDWKPYNGKKIGTAKNYAFNQSESNSGTRTYEKEELGKLINPANLNDFLESAEEISVNEDAVSRAMDYCRSEVESEIHIPGDNYTDMHSEPAIDILETRLFRLPYFKTKFVYQGTNYFASEAAFGRPDIQIELPKDREPENAIAPKTKTSRMRMIIGWIVGGALVTSGALLGQISPAFYVFVFAGLALGITFHVLFRKKRSAEIAAFKNTKKTAKINACKELLSSYRFAPLTESELDSFE